MASMMELQRKIEFIDDEIADIVYATNLNLQALEMQCKNLQEGEKTISILNECKVEFKEIQQQLKERNSLRLQLLMTQQIKQEECRVRRERLSEYEQKILDQRRLIADKQVFYESLLRPKKKRPQHLSVEEYQMIRKEQVHREDKQNIKQLEQQVKDLRKIQQFLKADNALLEDKLQMLQRENLDQSQLVSLFNSLEISPVMYSSLQRTPISNYVLDMLTGIASATHSCELQNEQYYKIFQQQKQMYQYLKWENNKLRAQYLHKQEMNMQLDRDHRARLMRKRQHFTRSVSV